jgi:ketosteroid isomerase-like protein
MKCKVSLMKFIRTALFILTVCLMLNSSLAAQTLNKDQRAVWQTVQARWDAWQKGDVDTMLTFYEPKYRRWNTGRPKLDSRDDLAAAFKAVKAFERPVSMTLESIVIDVFGDAAVAHYVSREIVTFTEDAPIVKDKKVKAGENVEWPIRWSEFLIKKKGRWQIAGGSRDGTCAIFQLSPIACRGK